MQYLINLWHKSGIAWAASAIVAYLATITGWTEAMVAFVFLLIGVDTAFGLYIAFSKLDIEGFQSHKFARVLQKVITYFGTAIIAYQFGNIFKLEGNAFPGMENLDLIAPNIIFSLIVFTEMSSVFENAKILGLPVPQKILDWLQSVNQNLQK